MDAIFVEELAFFAGAGRHVRFEAAGVVDDARSQAMNVVLPQTRELFDAGLDLYARRLDELAYR
jgi:hypothetical protein